LSLPGGSACAFVAGRPGPVGWPGTAAARRGRSGGRRPGHGHRLGAHRRWGRHQWQTWWRATTRTSGAL